MRKFRNLPKIVFLAVILLTYTFKAFAQPPYSSSPSQRSASRPLSSEERKQQLEQQVTAAIPEVEAEYTKILSYVNSGQIPSGQDIEESLKIVARNRKYLPLFNNSQKGTYHVLSAWVYYFDNKQDKAVKQAVSGQKIAPQNPDAVKTRFALSVIYKDYTSVIESLTERNANTRTVPQLHETNLQSYQQTNEGSIQLDVNSVRIELLGKVFDSQPESVEPNSAGWKSDGRLVCALLWKIDANELDRFAPAEKVKPVEANEPNEPNTPRHEPNEPNLPVPPAPEPLTAPDSGPVLPQGAAEVPVPMTPSVENMPQLPPETGAEQQYQTYTQTQIPEFATFSQLQSWIAKDQRIIFAGINLNDPAKRKNLDYWLKTNPQRQTCQTFMLPAEQQQKMLSSFSGSFDKPILLIVAPDSTIRYAGNVDGFMPQIVIRSILENPQEFATADSNQPPVAVESNLPAVEPVRSVQLPAEPNIPPALTADVNKAAINTQQPQTRPQQSKADVNTASAPAKQKVDDGFSAADDYQAETLLSNARTFLKIGNRLPSHEYRNPIEWCRKVMKDYPNTKYAQEAQMLLRNVPEEHRQQYNLTNEELGL